SRFHLRHHLGRCSIASLMVPPRSRASLEVRLTGSLCGVREQVRLILALPRSQALEILLDEDLQRLAAADRLLAPNRDLVRPGPALDGRLRQRDREHAVLELRGNSPVGDDTHAIDEPYVRREADRILGEPFLGDPLELAARDADPHGITANSKLHDVPANALLVILAQRTRQDREIRFSI